MSSSVLYAGAQVPPQASITAPRRSVGLAEILVVGGSALAPLNLLLVRSFTVYDLMVGSALLVLLYRRALAWPPRRYVALAYVFLLATLVSAFRALHAFEALTQSLQYVFIFFIQVPVILSVVTTRLRALVSVVLLCLGTLAAIGYAYVTQPVQGAGRVLVFYSENPNRLGYPAVYLIPLLLVLWVFCRDLSPLLRLLARASIVLGLYLSLWAVSASGSRSSLVGSTVALLVFVVFRPGLGVVRGVARLLVLSGVCLALGGGLLATGQLPTTLEDRINRSMDPNDPAARAHLVADRENLMSAGIRAFEDSPWVGTGLDNFRYVTQRYDVEATPQLPHNLWLQLLVQVGLVGTAAFAAYLLLWVVELRRAARLAHPLDAQLLWGLVASMAGVLTVFLFAPELLDRHYWLMVGLGLAIHRGIRPAGATKGPAH